MAVVETAKDNDPLKVVTLEMLGLDTVAASLPGRTLFIRVAGSRSYNLTVDTPEHVSDTDYMGVFTAPMAEVLSVSGCVDSVNRKDPDVQAHEVRKFCELLLKGNPTMIEALFTEQFCQYGAEWQELCRHREAFLTQTVVRQYLGYIKGQMQRLRNQQSVYTTGGAYNPKFAAHLLRLGFEATRIVKGYYPDVFILGYERELLLRVRSGGWSQQEVETLSADQIREVEALAPWPLADNTDSAKSILNKWLLSVRRTQLRGDFSNFNA